MSVDVDGFTILYASTFNPLNQRILTAEDTNMEECKNWTTGQGYDESDNITIKHSSIRDAINHCDDNSRCDDKSLCDDIEKVLNKSGNNERKVDVEIGVDYIDEIQTYICHDLGDYDLSLIK